MADIENKDKFRKKLDRETLHLNGLPFENFETPPEPVDHDKVKAFQEKYSSEAFLGTREGIANMVKADRETAKFNRRTRKARINPQVNHDRNPAQE